MDYLKKNDNKQRQSDFEILIFDRHIMYNKYAYIKTNETKGKEPKPR